MDKLKIIHPSELNADFAQKRYFEAQKQLVTLGNFMNKKLHPFLNQAQLEGVEWDWKQLLSQTIKYYGSFNQFSFGQAKCYNCVNCFECGEIINGIQELNSLEGFIDNLIGEVSRLNN